MKYVAAVIMFVALLVVGCREHKAVVVHQEVSCPPTIEYRPGPEVIIKRDVVVENVVYQPHHQVVVVNRYVEPRPPVVVVRPGPFVVIHPRPLPPPPVVVFPPPHHRPAPVVILPPPHHRPEPRAMPAPHGPKQQPPAPNAPPQGGHNRGRGPK